MDTLAAERRPRATAPRWLVVAGGIGAVLAATVIVHGELCATEDAPTTSPLLPAEVETKMPASAALRKASSSAVTTYVEEPETE